MNIERTARRHFHDELDTLQERLMEMAGLVERSLARATAAVLASDPTGAKKVPSDDVRVDELEVEIDERVIELLALQQPMASDLRQIITSNKIANDLERMGDHAVNIAKAVVRLAGTSPIPKSRELEEMVEITRGMVSDSLAAYVARDVEKAERVCRTDDHVDNLKRSMFRILMTHMLEDPKRISGALELLLVSQNLERIADLATNVAEDVVFLAEGRTIKHGADGSRPRADQDSPNF